MLVNKKYRFMRNIYVKINADRVSGVGSGGARGARGARGFQKFGQNFKKFGLESFDIFR